MRALGYVAPPLSIAVLTLIAVLPWGLPSDDRFFLPMLPLVAIHYWSLRQSWRVPEWFVFAAGLALDILTHGPLGFWAMMYLIAYLMGIVSAPQASRGQVMRGALFALALAGLAIAAWAISSIYVFEAADWRPFAIGAGLAGLASLLVVPVLHILGTVKPSRDNARLEWGA